jgi:hypothetical protein
LAIFFLTSADLNEIKLDRINIKVPAIIKLLEKAFAKGYSFKVPKDSQTTILIKSTSKDDDLNNLYKLKEKVQDVQIETTKKTEE